MLVFFIIIKNILQVMAKTKPLKVSGNAKQLVAEGKVSDVVEQDNADNKGKNK